MCFGRTTIRKRRGSRWQNDVSTNRGIKKWFAGMLQKPLRSWQKFVTAQGNYFEGNFVNRCKVDYFCAISRFQELEAVFIFLCPSLILTGLLLLEKSFEFLSEPESR
jgi:hypothetical protein